MRREGIAGVVNRLRHTPLRLGKRQRGAVSLADGARIIDHLGDLELAALVSAVIPPLGNRDSYPTVHIGAPRCSVRTTDVIVLPGHALAPSKLRRAALVVEYDSRRIAQLEQAGCNVVSMDPPPFTEASLRRMQVLTRILLPSQIDYEPFIAPALKKEVPRLCLSLPEFPKRMQQFSSINHWGFIQVPGLRYHPSWAGAAHSYVGLATSLLNSGRSRAIIAQDDMVPGPDFDKRLEIAEDYWIRSGADMFAGLVTDYDDSFVLRRVVRYRGMTFLHLNKSVGLVCNMFGPRTLQHLAGWHKQIVQSGNPPMTIDRHIAATEGLDIVTTLPFLVRHRNDAPSTIWAFGNGRYDTLIDYSERALARLVREQGGI